MRHRPEDFTTSVGSNDFVFGASVLMISSTVIDDELDDCSDMVFVTVTLLVMVGLNCEEWSFLLDVA